MNKVIDNVQKILPNLHLKSENFKLKDDKIMFDDFYEKIQQILEAENDVKEDTEKYTEHDEVDADLAEDDEAEEHFTKADQASKKKSVKSEHEESKNEGMMFKILFQYR